MTKKTLMFNIIQAYIQIQLLILAIVRLIQNELNALDIGWVIVAMSVNILIYNLRKKEENL